MASMREALSWARERARYPGLLRLRALICRLFVMLVLWCQGDNSMAECAQQIETELPSLAPSPHVHHPQAWSPCDGLVHPSRCAVSDLSPDTIPGPFRKSETCIVFDWDDTLFPSSFIDRKRLIHARQFEEIPAELQKSFADLEKTITRLITSACQYGTVLIITNAQTGWVELTTSKFMPSLLPVLTKSVRIVSARSSFERFFPGDPLCWKAAAFAHELHQLQKTVGIALRNVMSFGDSIEERTAVKIAAGQLRSRAKSVKFLDAPSPRQLHQQIEVVANCLEWIWRHNGDLDVVLTLEPTNSPPASPRASS